MTQRQEIQLGLVPRSIVMAGEDQVGEHGDDRTRNERKWVDYNCPASRCGDNPTLLIGEYGSALHDQSVAHIMKNGVKEATCTLLTDSQQEIGVTYSDLSPYPQVGT